MQDSEHRQDSSPHPYIMWWKQFFSNSYDQREGDTLTFMIQVPVSHISQTHSFAFYSCKVFRTLVCVAFYWNCCLHCAPWCQMLLIIWSLSSHYISPTSIFLFLSLQLYINMFLCTYCFVFKIFLSNNAYTYLKHFTRISINLVQNWGRW